MRRGILVFFFIRVINLITRLIYINFFFKVSGKIVLFNANFTTYGETVKYRSKGPAEAAKLGAVAALVKSVTPFSIYSPHTGTTSFKNGGPKIPSACVTLEDADFLARLFKRGLIDLLIID